MKPATDGYILIDPPVNAFSSKSEILEWIAELETLPANPEVVYELNKAKSWLSTDRQLNFDF